EHRSVRIRNAQIDVAEGLQVEQARRVVGRVEYEGGGLVDRRGARAGGGVRDLARVQAKRLDAEFSVGHGRTLPEAIRSAWNPLALRGRPGGKRGAGIRRA